MRVIGITGGIASGKSSLVRLLAKRPHTTVVDTDALGHAAYAPGGAAYAPVVDAFGQSILASDGTVDRRALGGIVFADPQSLSRLNSIVWPCVRALANVELDVHRRAGIKVAFIESAVLVPSGWYKDMDEVWVVSVEPEVAVSRLMARNQLCREDAVQRVQSQPTNATREQVATVVIKRNGDEPIEQLEEVEAELWKRVS